tara:strand:- start:1240 stop:1800 length:561 start_codon:yes stop_codon:yes gene_type:complete
MALKRSSEIITVSGGVDNSANAFQVDPVDLMLNALDQEVFVVLAVQIDFQGLPVRPLIVGSPTGVISGIHEVAMTTTRPSGLTAAGFGPDIGNTNCFAYACQKGSEAYDASNDLNSYFLHEQTSDVPDTNLDYVAIIATSDFFVSTNPIQTNPGTPLRCNYRIWGYRAKADAATYAALVQSEVLSS